VLDKVKRSISSVGRPHSGQEGEGEVHGVFAEPESSEHAMEIVGTSKTAGSFRDTARETGFSSAVDTPRGRALPHPRHRDRLGAVTLSLNAEIFLEVSLNAEIFLEGLKAGLLTFGGAYTVIPFLEQSSVDGHGWLTRSQFVDGLALSGILPAPLIIFSTFVGYVAGETTGGLLMTLGIFLLYVVLGCGVIGAALQLTVA
jgi:hypothetical protein